MLQQPLKYLSTEDMQSMHRVCLDILWERGMRITHSKARDMLIDAGARLNARTQMVCIPPDLVMDCLKKVPQRFQLRGRGQRCTDVIVGHGQTPPVRIVSGTMGYIDPESRQYRPATDNDVRQWACLLNGLENIHIATAMFPQNLPISVREAAMMKILWENTTKPLMLVPDDVRQYRAIVEMALAIRGGEKKLRQRPLMACLVAATSPGILQDKGVEMILLSGRYGIPLLLNSTPIMGATAPVTVAGGVVQTNLEVLAQIVIAQLAFPGTPVVHRGNPIAMDMAGGGAMAASVECALAEALIVQLVHDTYRIPVDAFGMHTDAVTADGQSQMERTLNTLLSALSGVSIIAGAGQMDHGNALDPVQLVLDDQLMTMIYHVLQGVEVDAATMAPDLIAATGPGEDFLNCSHTLRHFRKGMLRLPCTNRLSRSAWEQAGQKEMRELAQEKALKQLSEPKADPLDPALKKELDCILKAYRH